LEEAATTGEFKKAFSSCGCFFQTIAASEVNGEKQKWPLGERVVAM
jgi:hypothetical protein